MSEMSASITLKVFVIKPEYQNVITDIFCECAYPYMVSGITQNGSVMTQKKMQMF